MAQFKVTASILLSALLLQGSQAKFFSEDSEVLTVNRVPKISKSGNKSQPLREPESVPSSSFSGGFITAEKEVSTAFRDRTSTAFGRVSWGNNTLKRSKRTKSAKGSDPGSSDSTPGSEILTVIRQRQKRGGKGSSKDDNALRTIEPKESPTPSPVDLSTFSPGMIDETPQPSPEETFAPTLTGTTPVPSIIQTNPGVLATPFPTFLPTTADEDALITPFPTFFPTANENPFPTIPQSTFLPTPTPLCFESSLELQFAVDEYLLDSSPDTEVAFFYGHPMEEWCVSSIVDFSNLFSAFRNSDTSTFNEPLNGWDMSSAETLENMFAGAESFDQPLFDWDTSNVSTMTRAFSGAESFNSDIRAWDTSNVLDMQAMFAGAISFNGNIASWDIRNVENLSFMFAEATSFAGDLSQWEPLSAISMVQMFLGASSFNSDISRWDVSAVELFSSMFNEAISFNQDISGFDLSSATNLDRMMFMAESFSQDVCNWGSTLDPFLAPFEVFQGTDCPNVSDPSLDNTPPGPLCFQCS
jgi:surface protein